MKKLVNKLSIFLYPLARLYWFIFRPKTEGVKVILEHSNEVLLVRHSYVKNSHTWTFPGGRREKGESLEETARREMNEELGILIPNFQLIGLFVSDREYKIDTISIFHSILSDRRIFVDKYEIAEAKWFSKEEMPQLVPVALRCWQLYKNKI